MAGSFLLIFVAVSTMATIRLMMVSVRPMMATARPNMIAPTGPIICAEAEIWCRMANVTRCISQRLLCNGVRNCFNGEDELAVNCREYKRRKLFRDTSKHCYIESPPPPHLKKRKRVYYNLKLLKNNIPSSKGSLLTNSKKQITFTTFQQEMKRLRLRRPAFSFRICHFKLFKCIPFY